MLQALILLVLFGIGTASRIESVRACLPLMLSVADPVLVPILSTTNKETPHARIRQEERTQNSLPEEGP